MKKWMILVLVCALLLVGCSQPDESKGGKQTAAATEALAEGTVTFEIFSDAETEYALITCTADDGSVIWSCQTEPTAWAMCTTLAGVGRFENRYYYVANGSVSALSMFDGSLLWTNEDFGGWPAADCAVIAEDGTVYLAGYYGPDFFAVDASGNTLKRVDKVDPNYFWACRLKLEDDRAVIYMRGGPEGDIGTENAMPVYVDLP